MHMHSISRHNRVKTT